MDNSNYPTQAQCEILAVQVREDFQKAKKEARTLMESLSGKADPVILKFAEQHIGSTRR